MRTTLGLAAASLSLAFLVSCGGGTATPPEGTNYKIIRGGAFDNPVPTVKTLPGTMGWTLPHQLWGKEQREPPRRSRSSAPAAKSLAARIAATRSRSRCSVSISTISR